MSGTHVVSLRQGFVCVVRQIAGKANKLLARLVVSLP